MHYLLNNELNSLPPPPRNLFYFEIYLELLTLLPFSPNIHIHEKNYVGKHYDIIQKTRQGKKIFLKIIRNYSLIMLFH